MKSMTRAVDAFSGLKVAVLGDMMVDRYTCGQATRISQEAPVPVVLVSDEHEVPGGAANVVRNVLSLRAAAVPVGMVGDDSVGRRLVDMLGVAGAAQNAMVVVEDGVTTVKTRVLAGNQQVVRIDREVPGQISPAHRQALLAQLDQALADGCQALIMEDYAKGLFDQEFMAEAVRVAAARGVFATLDPHPGNRFNIRGLRLMTPNRREAFQLAGIPYSSGIGDPLNDQPLLQVARRLQQLWAPELLLITLGSEGMILFDATGAEPVQIPTQAQRVFDVSGAGDTVMAVMTLALLAGCPPVEAARIANYAAGIVVGYVGTRAIGMDELKKRLAQVEE